VSELVRVASDAAVQPGRSTDDLTDILCAISTVATDLDLFAHQALLSTLYGISLWTAPADVLDAWMDLILHKVSVRAAYVGPCVKYLVKGFVPVRTPAAADAGDAGHTPFNLPDGAVAVHHRIVETLTRMVKQNPATWRTVRDAAAASLPHKLSPPLLLGCYAHGLIRLAGLLPASCCMLHTRHALDSATTETVCMICVVLGKAALDKAPWALCSPAHERLRQTKALMQNLPRATGCGILCWRTWCTKQWRWIVKFGGKR
jgi:RNA polymerase I specific transcription initiation factor RRN3